MIKGMWGKRQQLVTTRVSQRTLQNEPIFRLLLKVAVKGAHKCEFLNFWKPLWVHTYESSRKHLDSILDEKVISCFVACKSFTVRFIIQHPCERGNSTTNDA